MYYENDASNLASFAMSIKQHIERRLVDFDDESDVRRLLRVHKNFADEVLRLVEAVKGKLPKDDED